LDRKIAKTFRVIGEFDREFWVGLSFLGIE